MLEIRPSCEQCNKPLPPEAEDALICSFECTFCRDCVEQVLRHNICPNCGGGFTPRPIRPVRNWKNANHLLRYPASTKVVYKPVDMQAYAELVSQVQDLPASAR